MSKIVKQVENWKTSDQRFGFEFYFQPTNISFGLDIFCTLNYLSVTGSERTLFSMVHVFTGKPNVFNFNETESGFQISGLIKVFVRAEGNSNYIIIWGDFNHGEMINQSHYEGVMFTKEIEKKDVLRSQTKQKPEHEPFN